MNKHVLIASALALGLSGGVAMAQTGGAGNAGNPAGNGISNGTPSFAGMAGTGTPGSGSAAGTAGGYGGSRYGGAAGTSSTLPDMSGNAAARTESGVSGRGGVGAGAGGFNTGTGR